MKKTFVVFLLFLILAVTVLGQTISAEQTYYYDDGDVEITIYHSGLPQDILNKIVADMTGASPAAGSVELTQPVITPMFNILCLFGHSIKSGMLVVTRHNVYTTTPKCVSDYYSFEYCVRSGCDYSQYVFKGSAPEFCH